MHQIPGLFFELQNSYEDWQYKSEREMATQSQQNHNFKLSSGKCLGGGSGIHHLLYLRGPRHDFDSWAEYLKDPSWKYKNILKYFIKSETLQNKKVINSKYGKYHGTKGPMKITKEPKKKSKKYLESYAETGTPAVLDLNGNESLGYTESMFYIGDGKRQNTFQAYLYHVGNRKNLFVLRRALVLKINIRNKIARSVKVDIGDNIITLKARQEIILSAGAFNSPQILMLSGIGPKEHLKEMNIEVVQDLQEVGKNMQDHVAVAFVHKMERSVEISELPTLTKLPFPVLLGGVTLDKSKDYPEYQIISLIFTHDTPYILVACSILLGYKNKICDRFQYDSVGRETMFSLVAVFHPESRGTVKLRSSDPNDAPVISENFYNVESDLDNMVRYIEDYLRINNTTYFRRVNSKLVDLQLEPCKNVIYGSTEYWRCYAKHVSTTLYHYTSTCAMGSVVDSEGKVYGVKRLRVVDASIMPNITRANPLATSIMMAEKISDAIKAN